MDREQVLQLVAGEAARALEGERKPAVLLLGGGEDMRALLGEAYAVREDAAGAALAEYEYIVVRTASLPGAKLPEAAAEEAAPDEGIVDLRACKLVSEQDLAAACAPGTARVLVNRRTVLTPLALDYLAAKGLPLVRGEAEE